MDRRTFLRAGAAAGVGGLAGCLGLLETESIWTGGPIVEDRPDAVYLPAASEEMGTYATRTLADGSRLSLHYTYPHRFWTVTGETPNLVEVEEGQVVHLMTSVWDPDAGHVLPRRPRATIESGDGPAEQYQLWPMLAQRMGYHFGNNVALSEDGSYDVRIDLDPLGVRGLGAYANEFDSSLAIDVEVAFSTDDVLSLSVDEVPTDRRGDRDAFEPMAGMGPPPGRVPTAEQLPGRSLGTARSGDAVVAGSLLDEAPAGVDGDGPYLVASPRTPYNRIALPGCSLSAAVGESGTADGETDDGATDDATGDGTTGDGTVDLVESLGPELGHHYGAVLDRVPGRGPTIHFDSPSQASRHDGYETAFFGMEPATLSAP